MHNLEHILFVTSVTVKKGKITMSELADVLMQLASVSHDYDPVPYRDDAPWPNADASLDELNQEWHRRFGHLLDEKNDD